MNVPNYIDDLALDGLRAGHGASTEAIIAYLDWRNRVRYSPAEVAVVLRRLEATGRATTRDGRWTAVA